MAKSLHALYRDTRQQSLSICSPLEIEDYGLQAEAFVSPPKWHLAHTSWFFETFLLKPFSDTYVSPDSRFEILFNSYYNGIGEQFPRPQRGLLSRPGLETVKDYRRAVDTAMAQLLEIDSGSDRETIFARTVLGIEHERQHQELFFTDIKYSLAINPLAPAFSDTRLPTENAGQTMGWLDFAGGLQAIGFNGEGFCFDNELPRHKVFLNDFQLSSRLVTNREYQLFVDDGGYEDPQLWLADGWATVQAEGWKAPLYWRDNDGEALEYTLHGLQTRRPNVPVSHVSGYEADAYARWASARLPTEFEWEIAAHQTGPGNDGRSCGMDTGLYHPRPAGDTEGLQQLYSDCWQWTQSAYGPYPGYRPSPGAIGEYNGKFMSNQWVLRGGSCVSKFAQLRPSYRNFFYPQDRWQFSGIRLARDLQ